jgi:hypothetical protein
MIEIRAYPFFRHLRSDASSHVMKFSGGRRRRSGRGLSFWFQPESASVMELPLDDRELPFAINARSADFQDVMVQGAVLWRIADVDRLSDRVDFSIDLRHGRHIGTPLDQIGNLVSALLQQAATDYLGTREVRAALDAGVRALQEALNRQVREAPELQEMGLAVIAIHVARLSPTPDLARALQTPTFERIQQAADEATFARRALAVEKEQAIAENELKTQIELARRERELIDRETENARSRAEGSAAAAAIDAESEAHRIRTVETAKTDAERERMAVIRDVAPGVLLGLAAQELAGKLETIGEVNITPDFLAQLAGRIGRIEA